MRREVYVLALVLPLFCNNTNQITVSMSNTHNHHQRAPITRASSPARNIVIKAVAVRLTQAKACRVIENQFFSHVS